MDSSRFDRLTRELAATTSRRGMMKLIAGATVALGVTTIVAPSSRAQPSAGCVGAGESCDTDEACCGRLTCGDAGTCGGPSAGCGEPGYSCATNDECCQGFYCNDYGICAGAAECAEAGGGCDADEICCGSLICDGGYCGPSSECTPISQICADSAECCADLLCINSVCAYQLPDTGVADGPSGSAGLMTTAIAGGAAAIVAAKVLRSQSVTDPTSER